MNPNSTLSHTTRVGLSVAALQVTAQAAVQYFNFPDVQIGPDPDPIRFNDLSSSVVFDLATPTIFTNPGITGARAQVHFRAFDDIQKKGKAFIAGRQTITFTTDGIRMSSLLSGSSTVFDGTTSWANAGAFLPLEPDQTDVFTGVRIESPNGSGNFRYGWIRFSTGKAVGGVGQGRALSITLKDAAIEMDLNTGIVATVPEPSTNAALAFLGLAGGTAAFRSLRRNRSGARPA